MEYFIVVWVSTRSSSFDAIPPNDVLSQLFHAFTNTAARQDAIVLRVLIMAGAAGGNLRTVPDELLAVLNVILKASKLLEDPFVLDFYRPVCVTSQCHRFVTKMILGTLSPYILLRRWTHHTNKYTRSSEGAHRNGTNHCDLPHSKVTFGHMAFRAQRVPRPREVSPPDGASLFSFLFSHATGI